MNVANFKPIHFAPVAQLDRVPDYESVCRPFESGRARQSNHLSQFIIRIHSELKKEDTDVENIYY